VTDWFRCNDCKKVLPLLNGTEQKCPSCGGTHGEVLSQDRVRDGFEAGTYFNIDPRTGKRSRKKPR
jgi:phage FluMu protein Com